MQGGKRKGAGRPPVDPQLKKVTNSIKIPQWLTDWLNEQEETKVELIEKALMKQYKLKSPKG